VQTHGLITHAVTLATGGRRQEPPTRRADSR